jgi:hypothetical protein
LVGLSGEWLGGIHARVGGLRLLTLLVVGWTGSYLWRVVSGKMTYMEQRRRYRATYDALTDDALLARFEALSPEEQEQLLRDVGQLTPPPTP